MRLSWLMILVSIVGVTIGALDINLYARWAYIFGDKSVDAFQESVDEIGKPAPAPTVDRL